jgi:hypothetical protein
MIHMGLLLDENLLKIEDRMAGKYSLYYGELYRDTDLIIVGSRKVWHSMDDYRCTIYQCSSKFKNNVRCTTSKLTEEEVKERFLTAYTQLIGRREGIIADCEEMRKILCDTTELDAAIQHVLTIRLMTELVLCNEKSLDFQP